MEMRSFSDYLRSVDDSAFLNLFNARPDLITPVPSDIASLAVRACSAPSLARAIDSLNQWQFQVLEAAASLNEPFTEKQVVTITEKEAKGAIAHLVMIGLMYDKLLRIVSLIVRHGPALYEFCLISHFV